MNYPDVPMTLHQQALAWADQAYIARRKGQLEASVELTRKALGYEIEAAKRLPPVAGSEPTRSVLYLAAASLAWQAKDYKLVLELTAQGRRSWPSLTLWNRTFAWLCACQREEIAGINNAQ